MPHVYHADQIVPNLLMGGYPPEGDHLKAAGVDVLVLCAAGYQDAAAFSGVEVVCAPGDDDERPHRFALFRKRWQDAAHEVALRVLTGNRVLVTCFYGQNRSGFVVALALRELTGWDGARIVHHIQSYRAFALNNTTFVRWVLDAFPEPEERP
jgi:protein-tyrosine phosphatase